MLSRADFKARMADIKTISEREDELMDALYKCGVSVENSLTGDAITAAIKCVESAMGLNTNKMLIFDTDIDYYIYELDWGRKGKDAIEDNGKKISLTNLDELYDYIVSHSNETEESSDVSEEADDEERVLFSIPAQDGIGCDLELIYKPRADRYALFVETATGQFFKKKTTYYIDLLNQFKDWMKDNDKDMNYDLKDFEILCGDTEHFCSVPEAFAWFKFFVRGMYWKEMEEEWNR